jgi:uracil-DNA glycosylase
MTNKNKNIIDESVITCRMCELCDLEVNDNSKYYLGYGKLLSRQFTEKPKIMIVGLNPSHERWPGLVFHYGGFCTFHNKYDNKAGHKLLQILNELNVLDLCYITNIVKCSTTSNQVTEDNMDICSQHLIQEILYTSPKLILATGKQVFDFISRIDIGDVKLEFINHPNYYFTYNKSKVKEYIIGITAVLQKHGFIKILKNKKEPKQ